jgi:monofunctional glycosyltransferase
MQNAVSNLLMHRTAYRKVFVFLPIEQISPSLQHAVVAAEDARFFQHHGFDWTQVGIPTELNADSDRKQNGIPG